jgi:hypothetical protein
LTISGDLRDRAAEKSMDVGNGTMRAVIELVFKKPLPIKWTL